MSSNVPSIDQLKQSFQQQSDQLTQVKHAVSELAASRSIELPQLWLSEFEAATEMLNSQASAPARNTDVPVHLRGIRA